MAHYQLTIRYDKALGEAIEREAKREGLSRNRAALRLLRKGAGLDKINPKDDVIGDSLDWFIGSATEEETRELEEALKVFETIDEELWR